MPNNNPNACAEECLTRARATDDVDQQSLLLFLAESWGAIARTGDCRAVVPAYLRQPAALSRRAVEPVS
jgi:hypothetical protein